MTIDFEKISLTARLAAYMRQFSDIPFARDVAELLHAREALETMLEGQQMIPEDLLWYAPIFEVRYKSITAAVRRSGISQILELASGLSLRGLALTQDPHIQYIESDLTGISAEKADLIETLRRKYGLADNGNLRFPVVDALDHDQLQNAVKGLRRDLPLAIVSEGLFPYLSPAEMRQVVGNIRDLLTEFKGCWITPDFSLKEEVIQVSEQQKNFRRIVAAATDRSMYNNAFDSLEQLNGFLDGVGLSAAVSNPLDDISEIVSLRTLNLPASLLDPLKPTLRLWVLSLAKK